LSSSSADMLPGLTKSPKYSCAAISSTTSTPSAAKVRKSAWSPAPPAESFAWWRFDELLSQVGGDLDPAARSAIEATVDRHRGWTEGVGRVVCHGDVHPGNILWTPTDRPGGGPHFVDLDDARTGPAVQDLWMLISGDRETMGRQLGKMLSGYEDFAEFDDRELQLVEALRTLRLLHYSAWLARRWEDPAFPIAFPFFNTQRYWQDRVLELREQVAAMQEPPIVPA